MDHFVLSFSHKMKVFHIELMVERSSCDGSSPINLPKFSNMELHTISSYSRLRLDRIDMVVYFCTLEMICHPVQVSHS